MLSGMLALLAACITVFYLKKQIMLSEQQEADRLRRQHTAARATLPLTLSGLISTIEKMLSTLNQSKSGLTITGLAEAEGKLATTKIRKKFELPQMPVNAVAELQQIILTTDRADVIQPISEIIRQMQTLWARVEKLRRPHELAESAALDVEVNQWIIQAAQIHAIIESIFRYARLKSPEGSSAVSWEAMASILDRMSILDDDLNEVINRGLKQSLTFWSLT
jgi:hypothetical protein